jgi:hypothetical protein
MTWMPNYTITPQIVVCAANRHSNGTIVLGARHFDGLMRKTISDRCLGFPNETWNSAEQGFIDQFGKFLTRTEAWIIAVKMNQIRRFVGGQNTDSLNMDNIELFSENLY